MPELPEVETIINDLKQKVLNKKIVRLDLYLPRIIKNTPNYFKKIIINNSFKNISRVGKLIIIELSRKNFLIVHLKMTGQLVYEEKNKIIAGGHSQNSPINNLPNKYTRVSFEFNDGARLFFNDMRTFGYLKIVSKNKLCKILLKYGDDPTAETFEFNKWYDKIKNRQTSIKAVLLNQSLAAGIGNIYADEILFHAGVKPARIARKLSGKEAEKIFKAIKLILKKAIKHRGTTFSDYVDADGNKGNFIKFLNVYGREGKQCKKCGGLIKKTKIAQRGTRYCPKCQK